MILKVEHDISFMGDRERIHQMMVILLDNAMKYTNEGGHIQIDCTQTNSSIRIRVKDDGIGVKREDIPKLFDRFIKEIKYVRRSGIRPFNRKLDCRKALWENISREQMGRGHLF